jgi:hypothetical protein
MPQALLFALGAIGAAIAARLLAREWQRVNEELQGARAKPVNAERDAIPVLRRDPVTGVYRPHR